MGTFQLTLTAAECQDLLTLLEAKLKETQIEEYRSRSPGLSDYVLREEAQIKALLCNICRQVEAPYPVL